MSSERPKRPPVPRSRFSGIDGVTQEEREAPPAASPLLSDTETRLREQKPEQQALVFPDAGGDLTAFTELPPLHAQAALPLARTWYRVDLERKHRPTNTIKSYTYDLMVLEQQVGPKQVDRISRKDIARFLGDASNKATRKRRLTSARRFFQFLIDERVLQSDPTEGYFPHHVNLRLPVPLFPDEQERLLAAAAEDEAWSELAIWLMLKLGLTRSELLGLQRDHIDRSDEAHALIYIVYPDDAKHSKERTLVADERFAGIYESFLERTGATDTLVTVGPPAVNSMVERVRRIAGIEKMVTPQVLRHSFAVDQARAGADQTRLLHLLGLSDDPRNRESVDRYLRLAIPVNAPED